MPNEAEQHIINPTEVCYRAFELMKGKQFDDAEKLLVNCMGKTDDDIAVALFHSALGVLFKLRGEFKTAWRHYQRAEKLMPEDPALKIIMARLLIDQFAEYDSAIKKAKKVLEIIPDNPVFRHQAHVTMGLAYIRKGSRKKAIEMLQKSMEGDFKGFVTTPNIDFNLVEKLLRRAWGEDICKEFLQKALAFARHRQEDYWATTIETMIKAFERDYVSKPKASMQEDHEKTNS